MRERRDVVDYFNILVVIRVESLFIGEGNYWVGSAGRGWEEVRSLRRI